MTTLCRMFCAAELDQELEALREDRELDAEHASAGAKELRYEEEGSEEEEEEEVEAV